MSGSLVMTKPSEKQAGYLVPLLFLATVGFLAYQIIPTYLSVQSEKSAFQSELAAIAGRATILQWQDRTIVSEIKDLARKRNFDIRDWDIRIQRRRGYPDVTIEATYGRTERFFGSYPYAFRFQSTVRPFEVS